MRNLFVVLITASFCCFGFTKNNLRKISNPYQLVWTEEEGEFSGMSRFFLDINNDKKADLFLGANSLQGNGGGPWHIFLATSSGAYLDAGIVNLQVVEVLPTLHNELCDLKTYLHGSASEGTLLTYSFNGKEYRELNSKKNSSEEYEKRIHPNNINVEYSGPQLNWKP